MPSVEPFHFRYRDPRAGKWTRARYVATRQEIAGRYKEFEVMGPGEVREIDPAARPFTPHLKSPLDAALRRYSERACLLGPLAPENDRASNPGAGETSSMK